MKTTEQNKEEDWRSLAHYITIQNYSSYFFEEISGHQISKLFNVTANINLVW